MTRPHADEREPDGAPQEAPDAALPAPPPLPGAGTPEGERLAEALLAFERGDYARVRALCDALLEVPHDEVARAARELRRRTEIDPMQVGVVLACLVIFGIITYMYVL